MRCLICHIFLVSFFCSAALSKTNSLAIDHETMLPDGNPSAMLVRRESGLALVPAFAHIVAMAPDSNKQQLASSPSLMALAEPPKHEHEALSPAPPAAPPVPGQPGIQNWGPTEAPAADHTWVICIIVGFVAVTIVAALIPLCVRRDASQSRKEAADGSSRKRAKGGYGSQRKGRKDGSSSESDEDRIGFGYGDNEDRIEPKGYGSKRKERKEASGASSSRVDTAKEKTERVPEEAPDSQLDVHGEAKGSSYRKARANRKEGKEEAPDSQLDAHGEARNETSESRATGSSYRQARATRKEHGATSSEAPKAAEVSGQEHRTSGLPSNRTADDEELQAPLLAPNLLDEEEVDQPSRSYTKDRASRKAQVSAGASQTISGSSLIAAPTQGELGIVEVQSDVAEEKTATASSRYGKDRASRKAKALDEPR